MKKVIAILGLAAASTLAYGQGLVYFYSFAGGMQTSTAISTYSGGTGTGGTSTVAPGTANGFYYTLLISSANPGNNDAGNAAWTQAIYAGNPFIGNNYPGLNGDVVGPNSNQATAVDNWGGGASMYFEIVGWSSSLGTTWSSIQSQLNNNWSAGGFFGTSTVGQATSGVPPLGTPASLFGTGTGQVAPFTMYTVTPVPEPTTLALAGLGGLSLLLLRRRKA